LRRNAGYPLVVEARYNTYRDAKEWELAMTMAKLKHESKPNSLEWLLNYADAHHQLGDTKNAIACLKDAEGRFGEEAEYLFRLGKYHAILGNVDEAKNLVRRVFKLNGSFKADFLEDPAFDSVWVSF
jgi:tetratricopeptide (TPR) repeat protein